MILKYLANGKVIWKSNNFVSAKSPVEYRQLHSDTDNFDTDIVLTQIAVEWYQVALINKES